MFCTVIFIRFGRRRCNDVFYQKRRRSGGKSGNGTEIRDRRAGRRGRDAESGQRDHRNGVEIRRRKRRGCAEINRSESGWQSRNHRSWRETRVRTSEIEFMFQFVLHILRGFPQTAQLLVSGRERNPLE